MDPVSQIVSAIDPHILDGIKGDCTPEEFRQVLRTMHAMLVALEVVHPTPKVTLLAIACLGICYDSAGEAAARLGLLPTAPPVRRRES